MPGDVDQNQLQALLEQANASLKMQSAKLENELWKAVRQTHMESGDVELF